MVSFEMLIGVLVVCKHGKHGEWVRLVNRGGGGLVPEVSKTINRVCIPMCTLVETKNGEPLRHHNVMNLLGKEGKFFPFFMVT